MQSSSIVIGCLTGRGLVQRQGWELGVEHFFPLNAYPLCKYLLTPILHSYQIQDGGSIGKYALSHPKYTCIAHRRLHPLIHYFSKSLSYMCLCFVIARFCAQKGVRSPKSDIHVPPFCSKPFNIIILIC